VRDDVRDVFRVSVAGEASQSPLHVFDFNAQGVGIVARWVNALTYSEHGCRDSGCLLKK